MVTWSPKHATLALRLPAMSLRRVPSSATGQKHQPPSVSRITVVCYCHCPMAHRLPAAGRLLRQFYLAVTTGGSSMAPMRSHVDPMVGFRLSLVAGRSRVCLSVPLIMAMFRQLVVQLGIVCNTPAILVGRLLELLPRSVLSPVRGRAHLCVVLAVAEIPATLAMARHHSPLVTRWML